jgi:hypothetical protein
MLGRETFVEDVAERAYRLHRPDEAELVRVAELERITPTSVSASSTLR